MADEERRETEQDRVHAPSTTSDGGREQDRGSGRRQDDLDDWSHERGRSPLTEREQRERWPVD